MRYPKKFWPKRVVLDRIDQYKTEALRSNYSHTSMLFAPAQPACVGRHVKSLVPVGLAVEITQNHYLDGNASLNLIVCSAHNGKLNILRHTLN